MDNKWKYRFLNLAEHIAQWSKDPSTKCGCVIVRPNKSIASVGFNGFPRGVDDSPNRLSTREIKYELTIHAEDNAILFAQEPLEGYSLFIWPLSPCERCACKIIQSGIKYVYAPPMPIEQGTRWKEKMEFAIDILREAGVHFEYLEKTK